MAYQGSSVGDSVTDFNISELAAGVQGTAEQIEGTLKELGHLTGNEKGGTNADGTAKTNVDLSQLSYLTTRLGIENATHDMNAAVPKSAAKVVSKASQALGST